MGICGETPHTANGPARGLFLIQMVMRVYEAKEAHLRAARGLFVIDTLSYQEEERGRRGALSMEKPKRPVSSPKETYVATSKESERQERGSR